MSRAQVKGARFGAATSNSVFANPARGFGGFSSPSSGSGLSYLAENPDFASISDANVRVSFKNLLKKDATTKTKALEELVAYVQAHPHENDGGAEEAILEAWVQIYPRTSIDNARRVRELSHTLQYELMKSARKRMEKRLPRVVAPWLAGLFDKDRGVSRAANDGLSSFLNSPDKVVQFWKKCQPQILSYATDAMQETKDTLSDERSTTPDDAEAKYFRVVGGSLSLVLGLLQKLDQEDLDKETEAYDTFFDEDKVWKSAIVGDSSTKKAACQLLWACLEKRLDSVAAQVSRLKKIFITEGLKSSQAGSAIEFVRVLTRLTQKFPEIWSSSSDKKTPISRLGGFLEKGSQGSQPKYWEYLEQLILSIPREHFTTETTSEILTHLRAGVSSREEPRFNAPTAWTCYIRITRHFITLLPAEAQRPNFVKEHVFPLIAHYLHPTPETAAWDIGGPARLPVLVEAFNVTTDRHHEDVTQAAAQEWTILSSDFCDNISNSLPEVSQDYQKSQEAIATEGSRWFTLIGQIHSKTAAGHPKAAQVLDEPSRTIVSHAIDLLANRNLKPFGAAAVLLDAGKHAPHVLEDEKTATKLESFLLKQGRDHMQTLLESRSSSNLLACVSIYGTLKGQEAAYSKIWTAWIESLLNIHNHPAATAAIQGLISCQAASTHAAGHENFQELLVSKVSEAIQGSESAWPLLNAAFANDAVSEATSEGAVQAALAALTSKKGSPEGALRALEVITNSRAEAISRDETTQMALLTALLGLTELNDETLSSRAAALRALIDRSEGNSAATTIIQRNLEDANFQSLGINTLYQQAFQSSEAGNLSIEDLFPNTNIWMQELQHFLHGELDPSLSITSPVGGAQFLIQPSETDEKPRIRRDRDGRSIPARMALYTSELLSSSINLDALPEDFQMEVMFLLSISVQMATDQITLMVQNQLWANLTYKDSLTSVEDFVSNARASINMIVEKATGWREGTDSGTTGFVKKLINTMIRQTKQLTPMGLYSSRALSEIIGALTDTHGMPSAPDDRLASYDTLKATPSTVLAAVALIAGFGELLESSKLVNTLCNRLISDVAGLNAQSEKTLPTLVLLNACSQVYESGEMPVPNNRMVFAVRQITSWLDDPVGLTPELSTEICRALQRLLPSVKDVFGPHWERTIEFCTTLWVKAADDDMDEAIPYVHASLRLMSILDTFEEPNDDLEDALKESAETTSQSLLELLKLPREKSTQPLSIVDGIVCRQVEKLPLKHVKDLSELYGFVASESRDIQTAAFGLLHRAIPAKQEQLSVDVLLEKTDARLPDELLSLLLDAPTLEQYSDEVLAQFPTPIRSYLLTWCLIFDAYSTASHKVRGDYTDHLKSEDHIVPLMEFMFDVLGHSASHPLNLDREGLTADNIQTYDLKVADSEPEERNLHWLLVHLFFLSLKYVPGLVKAWHTNCRSKQTTNAVKTWMTKHFSPIIVADILEEVATWAKQQDEETGGDDENELVVKVSPTAREITAGYEVDESLASIAIRVPPGYPLENVNVVSVNRVAVNEKKWNSWLMTTQGVITFSNGSIIDGLTTFRRNIVGALKGQIECAICYSVISTDKRMPDKKCSTCKNLFHRTCLYKWFQSSNQNTCPLCRNPIDYLGADVKAKRAMAA